MKASKMVGLFVLLASVFAGNAWADGYRGHSHGYRHGGGSVQFGVYVGTPWGYPPYPVYRVYPAYPVYPQPNYWPHAYVPPILVAPPSVYVEQQRTIPALEAGFWYYCNESRTYYPHVQQCAVPWQKVSPTPPQ